jgi:hypothetical protein
MQEAGGWDVGKASVVLGLMVGIPALLLLPGAIDFWGAGRETSGEPRPSPFVMSMFLAYVAPSLAAIGLALGVVGMASKRPGTGRGWLLIGVVGCLLAIAVAAGIWLLGFPY